MKINTILQTKKCCYIAEIGLNHNGSIDEAKKLIKAASDAGCNCVKFQIRNDPCEYESNELSGEIVQKYIKETFLDFVSYEDLVNFSRSLGLVVFASPWDLDSLKWCVGQEFDTLKIPSALASDVFFLKEVAHTKKELIVSTGMLNDAQVCILVDFLKHNAQSFILLHCHTMYPTPIRHLNPEYVKRLQEVSGQTAGYSGHDRGIYGSLISIEYGARVIEKHITLNRESYGIDHAASLLPEEFCELIRLGDEIAESRTERANCIAQKRLLPGEKANRVALSNSIAYKKDLTAGTQIRLSDLISIKGGCGITSLEFIGLGQYLLIRDVFAGNLFSKLDIFSGSYVFEAARKVIREQKIDLRIPVRYKDCEHMIKIFNTPKVEFHLTREDIKIDPCSLMRVHEKIDVDHISFHAPDIYEDDLIFTPFSHDRARRAKSRDSFKHLLDHVEKFLSFHAFTKRIPLITSISGYDYEGNKEEKTVIYDNLGTYLNLIHQEYPFIEVLPQTLPKFAWYLGGCRDVNFFSDPREILEFVSRYPIRLCVDIAHLFLACSAYKLNFHKELKHLAQYAAHWHIAGARGVDDEGVSLEEAEYNIDEVLSICSMVSKHGFVIETWNGHLDNGRGFAQDLAYLSRINL